MNKLTVMSMAAISAVAVLSCGGVLAQVNKCVDRSGKTIYSQSPCPGNTKSSSIRQAVPPAPPGSEADAAAKTAAPKSAAELELDFKKRRVENAESARKSQEKLSEEQSKMENCRNAKGTLASLDSGARQSRINENGERYFLDDNQLAQEKERARKGVEAWCK